MNRLSMSGVRNACDHGSLLYDLKPPTRIRRGPAFSSIEESGNIIGALRVVRYIMEHIYTFPFTANEIRAACEKSQSYDTFALSVSGVS